MQDSYLPFTSVDLNYVDFPADATVSTIFNKVGRMKTALFEVVIILHD